MFTFWKVNIKSHENYPRKYTPENFPRKITSQIIDPIKLPQEDYSPLQIIASISLLPRKKNAIFISAKPQMLHSVTIISKLFPSRQLLVHS